MKKCIVSQRQRKSTLHQGIIKSLTLYLGALGPKTTFQKWGAKMSATLVFWFYDIH